MSSRTQFKQKYLHRIAYVPFINLFVSKKLATFEAL